MLIQTLNRRFEVIRALGSDNDTEILVSRDVWEKKEREYLMVAVKNPDLIYKCIPFFTEQQENPAFKDFVGCFSADSRFYAVFAYYKKALLKEKFNEELFSLNERLEIGKNLLSRIVLLNMPPSILYEVLQERNLLLDDALHVYFNYALKEIPIHGLFSMDRVQIELGRIFRSLLRRELATQVVDEVRLFVEDLEQCKFAGYMEIYEAYDRLYDTLKDLQEIGELNPQSFLFRCWERIKSLSRYVKPVLAGAVLILALGYLIYSINNPVIKPKAPSPAIETIGTVQAE